MYGEYQIIMSIESQHAVNTQTLTNGDIITTIENIGTDKDGKRWRYFTTSTYHSKSGLFSSGEAYGFVPA